MAKYVGKGGVLTLDTDIIGNLNDWELSVDVAPIAQKSLGDQFQEYSATATDHPIEWSMSATVFFDDADAGHVEVVEADTVAVVMRPRGTTTGDPSWEGNCIVTQVTQNADTDGMLEMSFELTGNGALTRTTVP